MDHLPMMKKETLSLVTVTACKKKCLFRSRISLSLNSVDDSHRNRNTGDLSVMLSESETHHTNEPRQINRGVTSKLRTHTQANL
jgi:hypothetical protein